MPQYRQAFVCRAHLRGWTRHCTSCHWQLLHPRLQLAVVTHLSYPPPPLQVRVFEAEIAKLLTQLEKLTGE